MAKKETEITVSDELLTALLEQNSKLQSKESEYDGVRADYLLLAKPGSKALKKSEKELYIDGLSIGDIYIQKDKVNLGSELKVVPLAFITLYNEKDILDQKSNFFGVWNKTQALTYPVVEGSSFNRQLPNGHILVPVNWVVVNIIGHHEIENAVIAFKSTGSRIWRKWKEDAKMRSTSSATLVYKIAEEYYSNDKFDWTDFGFTYVENLLETDKEEAVYCLKKSNAVREAYENQTLIGNRDTSTLAPKALEDNSFEDNSFEDDDPGF